MLQLWLSLNNSVSTSHIVLKALEILTHLKMKACWQATVLQSCLLFASGQVKVRQIEPAIYFNN